ncbi:MAG: hypothetical protein M1812_005818 [Candelaria pacifica]|nr:MAG: hypothetical protein M1812_005818 [Candelaria pacifica]
MSRTTIALSKFVGSVSLGLLTGLSYSLSTITLPTLLCLPSATTAHKAFLHLKITSKYHLRLLSAISASSLLIAYILSPSRARHPYLLWTALTVALSGGVDFALRPEEDMLKNGKRREVEDEDVNEEQVRQGMERWKIVQSARAGISGFGFGMSIVGIWGDGF